jgi:hypothetical protein
MTAAELKQRLEKKATFEAAVKELKARLQDPNVPEPALAELLQLCSRVATLLKTLYANPAFFRAGSDLFQAAIVSAHVDDLCLHTRSCHRCLSHVYNHSSACMQTYRQHLAQFYGIITGYN